jgi:hypothetical protein
VRRTELFTTIRSEGGLLPADLLARVAAGDPTLESIGAEAYHLTPGERLGEATSRSWNRLVGAWAGFRDTLEGLGPTERTATEMTRRRWSLVLFQELGYGQLQVARSTEIAGRSYPISHAWGAVPAHLVGARVELDRRTPGVAGAATMSPHGLVQEFLNRSDDHLWGLVTNGLRLRLLRDNASLTRAAYVEFDLEAMFTGQVYADFVVLWLVCHQSRLEGDPPEKCVLERWRADAAERGTRALEQLRGGVEQAIVELGAGFLAHPANAALRERLRSGALDKQDYYRQLLRLVYRVLFLLVAESRDLLLDPHGDALAKRRYRAYYSVERLRRLAESRRGSAHGDLWAGLAVVVEGLSRPDGLPVLGLPGLGGFLWSDRACPDLDGASLANRSLLGALSALTTTTDGKLRRSVDYRNLGAEELGSVYESLLELHPELHLEGAVFNLSTAGGNERKTTGSYYTPTSLITELLDSALDPVLDEAAAGADPEAAILGVTVLDPACGSGHFLIAAAHRIAKRLASVRTGDGEPAPEELRRALRDVIGRCVHGVDANEMAVELCKVSLWMEAVEPGKPLSFLDHRIVCGNSLLGATPRLLAEGVPDAAFKPLEGDDKAFVTSLRKTNKRQREWRDQLSLDLSASVAGLARPLAEGMAAIDRMPDERAADLAAKEAAWAELVASSDAERAQVAADAWCAAFVAPKRKGAPVITDEVVRRLANQPEKVEQEVVDEVRQLRDQYRFLHPHLAFPDVFSVPADGEAADNPETGWSGGFSVVLGNPPWEHAELKEKEWFAVRSPEIAAAPTGAARKRMIAALIEDDPELSDAFLAAARHADGERFFFGSSGRFPLCGKGRINTYAVFAEAMRSAISPVGRVGMIVPSGIATDDTTKHFFADLVERRSLVSMMSFENEEFIFSGIHHATRFCLLTLTGERFSAAAADFVFFARSTADLAEPERRFTLNANDFALLNPNTRTCPVFRTRRDAELTKAIYRRVPVLVDYGPPERNPWGVTFKQGLFNMTSDSGLFRTRAQLEADGWTLEGNIFTRGPDRHLPLYEAKMLHHFNHRWGTYRGQTEAQANQGKLPEASLEKLEDSCYTALPRYWVSSAEVQLRAPSSQGAWFLGFRDITGATVLRTVIAAVLPAVAVSNKLPLLQFKTNRHPFALGANLSSLALDYVGRQKMGGTSLNFFILKQLPVLPPETYDRPAPWHPGHTLAQWLTPRVLELTYTAWDLEGFAADLGYSGPPFRWDDERRALLRAELDGCFFHLYGIERLDVDYIMGTFPIVERKDRAKHGEYRTKRLILEAYDAMAAASSAGTAYPTVLDPPPADPAVAHPASTRPPWSFRPQ